MAEQGHLVLDAYRSKTARDVPAPLTGDLRTDLQAHLGRLAFTLINLESARTVTEITSPPPRIGLSVSSPTDPAQGTAPGSFDILTACRARGQVRSDADLAVAADAAFGAIHHRLLLTKAPIDGPFIAALTGLIVGGLSTSNTGTAHQTEFGLAKRRFGRQIEVWTACRSHTTMPERNQEPSRQRHRLYLIRKSAEIGLDRRSWLRDVPSPARTASASPTPQG